jgi:hypothetical protein
MIQAIKFAMRYRKLIPILIEFISICVETAGDKKLTKKEQSKLMKQYWVIIKAIQDTV